MSDSYPVPRGTVSDQLAIISAQLAQIITALTLPEADLAPIRARIEALQKLVDLDGSI